jgi:uncharacterized protein YqjF (DUF2071 family)
VSPERIFLTAEWRNLILLNYEVDARLLLPFVPAGTEIDSWNARVFVSLVGFQFLRTRVFGLPIPLHTNFDEVNLRFYVRRREGNEVRRGVVFIREIVPRRAIALVARTFYNENYVALPMVHDIRTTDHDGIAAAYRWQHRRSWSEMRFESQGNPEPLLDGSEEQFIAEHYWGYAAQPDRSCVEYKVTHPSWSVWQARLAKFNGNVEELYGREFAAVLSRDPDSAFLAEGSAVTVMRGRRL